MFHLACLCRYDWSWLWSPKDYWYAFVGALVGAGIALMIAHFQEEKRVLRERERIKKGLLGSLAYNKQLVVQATGELQKGIVPNFPMDYDALSSWISRAQGIISDDVLGRVTGLRFQLLHISKKIEALDVAKATFANDAASVLSHLTQAHIWILERTGEVEREGLIVQR